MKAFVAVLALALAACTGRQVEVGTGPEPAAAQAAVALRVTNTLSMPVNVYVVRNGSEMFVRQIDANSTQEVTVQGVEPGATVTLRARQVDGVRTYERPNVTLGGGVYEWRVP
ncbi:MAG TPA: hypothetical protein VFS08_02945 [Gemmatimonadaceae bacterium]|nr:hypothetical protein [Gemmatimonadaceae bacterium]